MGFCRINNESGAKGARGRRLLAYQDLFQRQKNRKRDPYVLSIDSSQWYEKN